MSEGLKLLLVEKGIAPLAAGDIADQLEAVLDAIMEGIYLVTSVLGGEFNYTYTTKAGHEIEMVLRAK